MVPKQKERHKRRTSGGRKRTLGDRHIYACVTCLTCCIRAHVPQKIVTHTGAHGTAGWAEKVSRKLHTSGSSSSSSSIICCLKQKTRTSQTICQPDEHKRNINVVQTGRAQTEQLFETHTSILWRCAMRKRSRACAKHIQNGLSQVHAQSVTQIHRGK